MRAIKLLIPPAIFLLISVNLQGQTNFLKGYYISMDGETVHGYINYRRERKNNIFCVFKKNPESKPITLLPEDIAGFVVDNKDFYETHSVENKKQGPARGFFKVVLKGKLTLLRFNSRSFAKDESGKLFEISKRREVHEGRALTDYYGLGVLKFLMQDCETISAASLEKEYQETSDFTNLFRTYNACVGSPAQEYEIIYVKPHVSFGVQVFPGMANLSLGLPFTRARFDQSVSYGVGGYVSFFLPRVDENLRLIIEANYMRYNGSAMFRYGFTDHNLSANLSSLRMPLVLRYSANPIFFDLGMQTQFMLQQNLQWRSENIVEKVEHEVPPINTLNIGYLGGVGVKYKLGGQLLMTSFRYSYTRSKVNVTSPTLRTIEIVLALQLTK